MAFASCMHYNLIRTFVLAKNIKCAAPTYIVQSWFNQHIILEVLTCYNPNQTIKEGRMHMNSLFIQKVLLDFSGIQSNSYLHKIEPLANLDELTFTKNVTYFVGENGTGKSTLLEAIAIAQGFNPEGGTKNYAFSTRDSHSELCDHIKLLRGIYKESWGYFLRAESFYNVTSQEENYNSGNYAYLSHQYHSKSHGESFLAVLQDNLRANSLYIFDEPEAALSPTRQLTLLLEIHKYAKKGAQFIIATHSPILLGLPNACIFNFDDGAVEQCSYKDTSSYQITEMFINNRKSVLRELFEN